MSDKVLILGCGPAGVFAAWAAERAGYEVRIVSKRRRSYMFGAQYLHWPLPGIETEDRWIRYELVGTPKGYRNRVYGGLSDVDTSVDLYEGIARVWDIRSAYNQLYSKFEDRIDDSPGLDGPIMRLAMARDGFANQYDFIFNTIPLSRLCEKPAKHMFRSQRIWALGDAPEMEQKLKTNCPPDTVLCNGRSTNSLGKWYRISNIFGYQTIEWPSWYYPGRNAAEVLKPISNNCDCHPEIVRLGRYGKWTKGELSHEAFIDVSNILGVSDGR